MIGGHGTTKDSSQHRFHRDRIFRPASLNLVPYETRPPDMSQSILPLPSPVDAGDLNRRFAAEYFRDNCKASA
ncbi:hypothetical protein T4B_10401 [Trichinella pseudospiralis]|uniref:Uncharacterized protein n=1 Tax=Trichinella pseudospiralis TaxID=6337 RepID=A0A0V1K2E9_TRIPS|nr:hypothetical protein T4A_11704 [Trichinella pseudospiralis]KRZ26982.1 hypothetical protein T4B_10401 [Trichinella pseudospiralis]KRZ41421.1 hypothetical protein T4C_4334 [Trichinella pseudospiralis]